MAHDLQVMVSHELRAAVVARRQARIAQVIGWAFVVGGVAAGGFQLSHVLAGHEANWVHTAVWLTWVLTGVVQFWLRRRWVRMCVRHRREANEWARLSARLKTHLNNANARGAE